MANPTLLQQVPAGPGVFLFVWRLETGAIVQSPPMTYQQAWAWVQQQSGAAAQQPPAAGPSAPRAPMSTILRPTSTAPVSQPGQRVFPALAPVSAKLSAPASYPAALSDSDSLQRAGPWPEPMLVGAFTLADASIDITEVDDRNPGLREFLGGSIGQSLILAPTTGVSPNALGSEDYQATPMCDVEIGDWMVEAHDPRWNYHGVFWVEMRPVAKGACLPGTVELKASLSVLGKDKRPVTFSMTPGGDHFAKRDGFSSLGYTQKTRFQIYMISVWAKDVEEGRLDFEIVATAADGTKRGPKGISILLKKQGDSRVPVTTCAPTLDEELLWHRYRKRTTRDQHFQLAVSVRVGESETCLPADVLFHTALISASGQQFDTDPPEVEPAVSQPNLELGVKPMPGRPASTRKVQRVPYQVYTVRVPKKGRVERWGVTSDYDLADIDQGKPKWSTIMTFCEVIARDRTTVFKRVITELL